MLKTEHLRHGQRIYLKSLEHTSPIFSSNSEMAKMVGHWGVVSGINHERQGFKMKSSTGTEYIFSIKDALIDFEPKGPTKIILNRNGKDSLFDENQLFV